MVTTVLLPRRAVLGTALRDGAWVLVEDGVVAAVGAAPDPPPAADRELRVAGALLPGLIDLQTNGAGGRSVDEATPDALEHIARAVWAGGAAAFLPTLVSAPLDVLCARLAAVASWIDARAARETAAPLGIHLEGPFLEVAGAHDSRWLCDPTPQRVDALLEAAGGRLALVTLAPGRPGAPAAVARLRAAGVAVALGHAASAAQLLACVDAGAGLVTHLFNAMPPMHHRDPGPAGLALDEARLRCSLIADGHHVDAVMVRLAFRCLGAARTVLVTDATAAAGMPEGTYQLAGQAVELRGGAVRAADGRLAGSALTMATAAARWLQMVGADLPALAQVAAANPAAILGREELGRVSPGAPAKFAVWRDGELVSLAV